MPSRNNDILIRVLGAFEGDQAFKSAEQSANAMARALDQLERRERALANAQIAAQREGEQRAQAARDAALSLGATVGKVAVTGGAALAAGLGLAAKAAMDWETAWTGVKKTVDGTPEQLDQVEQELRQLARTLPSTHEEIAAVAEAAGQLGVKTPDIARFTKVMIDLGQSTNLSSEDAATGLAQLMNIMQTAPQNVDRLGATLVDLGNNGASTEAQILDMALRIAGAGKTIGLTESQVLGFSNALASVGIDAEAGGSAISRVMIDIAKSVDAGGAKLDGFARVAGMSSAQFQQAFRDDAGAALAAFIGGLGNLQATGQSTFKVLGDLGLSNIRVQDTLLRAANAGDLLTQSLATGNQAWQDNTALVEEASKRYQTAESRIKIARNQLNDAAIDIGANVLPAISAVAERGGTLAEVFHELPGPVKQGVTLLGGLAAAASISGGAILLLLPKIAALRASLETMGTRGARGLRALNATTALLSGPWGIALAAGGIALAAFANHQLKAKQHVDDLRKSLDEQTGAITALTRQNVFEALQDNGAIDDAKRFGLSIQLVTAAALGDTDAQHQLALAHERATAATDSHDKAMLRLAANRGTGAQWDEFISKINGQTGALGTAREKWDDWKSGTSAAADSASGATSAIEGTTGALGAQQQSASEAEQAIKDLKQALDDLNGVHLNARAAARAYEQAVDDANEALKKNGKTLDIHTQKGRDNSEALDAMATKANDSAKAILDETGSEEKMRASLAKSRKDLIATAQKFGMSETAAEKYADKVLGIPPKADTEVNLTGVREATDRLREIKRAIDNLRDKTVHVTVVERGVRNKIAADIARRGAAAFDQADGGVVSYFADGAHVAQIAPAGAWRVWAEPETGGEAYIPLAPGKRDRSKAILDDVAAQFGAKVVYFASGSSGGKKAAADPLLKLRSQYGRWLDNDAVGALIGMPDAVVSDSVQRINTAFDKVGQITDKLAKSHKRSAKELTADAALAEKALSRIADSRDKTVDKLKDVSDQLQQVNDQYDSLVSNVASQAGARGALDKLFFGQNENGDDVVRSWQDVAAGMQGVADDTDAFVKQIEQLRGAGLNESLIQQIIGEEKGPQIAAAILAGGQAAISEFNRTADALTKASQALGKQAADGVYGGTKAALEAQVAALKAEQSKYEQQMVAIGEALAAALERGLTGKSTKAASKAVQAAIKAAAAQVAAPAQPKTMIPAPQASVRPLQITATIINQLDSRVVGQSVRSWSIDEARINGTSGIAL